MSDQPSESTEGSAAADVQTSVGFHPAVQIVGMVVAGAVAATICVFAISSVGDVYPIPQEVLNLGATPTEAERAAAGQAQRAADTGNAMVWLGMTGAILGGVLALSTGLLHRAGMKIALGTGVGILAGAGFGLLSGKLAVAQFSSIKATLLGATSNAEQQFMMMHGMTWGLIGLGVGLGCGLGRRTIDARAIVTSMVVAGVLGGVAGGVFPIVLGVAAPLVTSAAPIAAPGTAQSIWIGLAAMLMGAGLGRAN